MLSEYQPATETQIKDVRSFPQSIHIIPRYSVETGVGFFHIIRRKHSFCHNNCSKLTTVVNTTMLNNIQFYSTQDSPLEHNKPISLCKVTGQFWQPCILTRKPLHVYVNIKALSREHCCLGKTISIIHSVCVSVALVIRHGKRARPTVWLSVVCPALPYFSVLSRKRHDFRKNTIGYKVCILIFSTTFKWNDTHSKNNLARYYQKYIQAFIQYRLCSFDFNEAWKFSC
jgi:hypothetical protein